MSEELNKDNAQVLMKKKLTESLDGIIENLNCDIYDLLHNADDDEKYMMLINIMKRADVESTRFFDALDEIRVIKRRCDEKIRSAFSDARNEYSELLEKVKSL